MGALPKQRISRMRQGKRRSQLHLLVSKLTPCPQCHTPRLPHHVCPVCGTYNGVTVIEVEPEKKKQ